MDFSPNMYQIAVALCLTLLLAGVPLLVPLCICRSTLLFFISDEWSEQFYPLHTLQMLRMKQGIQKCPQNPKIF